THMYWEPEANNPTRAPRQQRHITTTMSCTIDANGMAGQLTVVDVNERVVAYDPAGAVWGSGSDARSLIAYESHNGIEMKMSKDGGVTHQLVGVYGTKGAQFPRIITRERGGKREVNLF